MYRTLALLTTSLALVACKKKGEIVEYTVPKSPAPGEMPAMPAGMAPTSGGSGHAHGSGFHWELPANWSEKAGSAMRLATIVIPTVGEDSVEASISVFGGNLAANINRWRQQAGLEPLEDQALAASMQPVETRVGPGFITPIYNDQAPANGILGAIIPLPDEKAIFIKATGPNDQLKSIQSDFILFTESICK
ncbi:hypothetical protein [Persicirhabdus sediminis]|uniref:Lipoprotein n=1 Tax=Persicirhabdus sediminis TaxID=454144 RepID=A0A8J7MH68_9BACT|nr:hypothetical protein [Persicirhabdus sediminis]MBK1792712.1 hypothetical protein [Persicirhabdus sediminis]